MCVMFRQALVILALAFAGTTLHGCSGTVKSAKSFTGFLHNHCKDALKDVLNAIESKSTVEDCAQKDHVLDTVSIAVRAKWQTKCIAHIGHAYRGEIMNFDEHATDLPDRVVLYLKNNTKMIKEDFQEKINNACEGLAKASEHAQAVKAAVTGQAEAAKAIVSEHAEAAKPAVSEHGEATKSAAAKAQEKAEEDYYVGGKHVKDNTDHAEATKSAAAKAQEKAEEDYYVDGKHVKDNTTNSRFVDAEAAKAVAAKSQEKKEEDYYVGGKHLKDNTTKSRFLDAEAAKAAAAKAQEKKEEDYYVGGKHLKDNVTKSRVLNAEATKAAASKAQEKAEEAYYIGGHDLKDDVANSRLFEVVSDPDDKSSKVSNLFAVLAQAGFALAVLGGVAISFRLSRQSRTMREARELTNSDEEAQIE